MATKISFDLDTTQLVNNIRNFDSKFDRVVTAQMLYHRNEMTKYARDNAPWNDITGNARSGLHTEFSVQATASGSNKEWQLILAHSVYYGIYLETRWSGRYAIIEPTVNVIAPLLFNRLSETFSKMQMQ